MADAIRRVALVTGGSRGIGLGIARHLCRQGYAVAINGRRPAEAVQDALDGLQKEGGVVAYFAADLADSGCRQDLVTSVIETFKRIDVLVNNAGIAPDVRADLLDATEESFSRLMHVNLQAPYFLTQAVARHMVAQERDHEVPVPVIVNISSVSAVLASVQRGDYCISKAGLSMMTKLWACRLAEFGIQVHEVRPGIIRTDMTSPVVEKYDRLLENGLTLEPRWGTPDDVGRLVATLAAGQLTYMNGGVWDVDGGMLVPRL